MHILYHLLTAQAAGDPHLVTLDGKGYSFNGVGDFILVQDVNSSVVIQVRAEQATDKNGRRCVTMINTSICPFLYPKDAFTYENVYLNPPSISYASHLEDSLICFTKK